METIIETARLRLRTWTDRDRKEFRRMNADPDVMKYLPAPLSGRESDLFLESIRSLMDRNGFGLWAVETRETGEFIGFTGLHPANFESPFTPCIEIGWRLKKDAWGNGYATEGARQCLEYGFRQAGLREICSFTSRLNIRSEKVMKRIGLIKRGEFDPPGLKPGDPLRPHVLYGITAKEYSALIYYGDGSA